MARRIDPEVRSRAVRLVTEHRSEYTSERAVTVQFAQSLDVSRESVRGRCSSMRSTQGTRRVSLLRSRPNPEAAA